MIPAKPSVLIWLFGGALAASLAWNAVALQESPTAPVLGGPCSSCVESVEKLVSRGELALSDPERSALLDLMRRCDESSARSEARAAELSRELLALLRDPGAEDAAIRARAKELAELRAAAVESCVESSLSLRALLGPERGGRLLQSCCGEGCCRSAGE
jgi:Spy/CpxP family protein refolding chaperone